MSKKRKAELNKITKDKLITKVIHLEKMDKFDSKHIQDLIDERIVLEVKVQYLSGIGDMRKKEIQAMRNFTHHLQGTMLKMAVTAVNNDYKYRPNIDDLLEKAEQEIIGDMI